MDANGSTAVVTSCDNGLRAPHRATGAVVMAEGSDIAKMVYSAFARFNRDHFSGALAAPLVLLTQAASTRTFGDYIEKDVHGLQSRIRISPAAVRRGQAFVLDVLLHEMIHTWQHEVDGEIERGYRGHGPRFAGQCNKIGAGLGLPPVGVKGRDGLPDCAHWPLVVRPREYYPRPYAAPTRRPPGASSAAAHAPVPAAGRGTRAGRLVALVHTLDNGILEDLVRAAEDELAARKGRQQSDS